MSNSNQTQGALIRISVHMPNGQVYNGPAEVVLEGNSQQISLTLNQRTLVYEAVVDSGTYNLTVSTSEDLASPARSIEIPPEGKTASAYLGREGWPFYRLGENIVPFEPHENLIAVSFPLRQPSIQVTSQRSQQLVTQLPLEPYDFSVEDTSLPFTAAEGAIWLYQLTETASADLRLRVATGIREILGEQARVGMPVDLTAGQVKVMDNQFVIRFRNTLQRSDIDNRIQQVGGRILRNFIQSSNAWLVEFLQGDYRDHLRIIEEWYEEGLLVYGEPNIMAYIADDGFPENPPNDPTYTDQKNLTLQGADKAWQILNSIDPDLTLGNPNVYVMSLDRGVDTDHPDIGGNLTDGTPQLAQCYDFSDLISCTVPDYEPDTSHGMGVYGIIAALTDNNIAIAGIAPNTHQIALKRPKLDSTNYSDILLWAAGFTTDNSSPGWPAEPISPAADIINCSHGVNGLALSGIMDDTLRRLANTGRGGKGTLVIYSAGNDNQLITGYRTWAAHPCTMAIANSAQPDDDGVERKVDSSNFGPEIDICAQGQGAPSLNHNGGERTFGGTSAAAPTVAAAAALMLSVNPELTWIQLRDILRETAVMIDPDNDDSIGQWENGFSQWYGYGRLNIEAAVQRARELKPT